MKKKKYPTRWAKQKFRIELYHRMWLFGRKVFYVNATTTNVAMREFEKKYPRAQILCAGPVG